MKKIFFIALLFIIFAFKCRSGYPSQNFRFQIYNSDTINISNNQGVSLRSIIPIQKTMNYNTLLFDANTDSTVFEIKNNLKLDTFFIKYKKVLVEEHIEVEFSDFQFFSKTLKLLPKNIDTTSANAEFNIMISK